VGKLVRVPALDNIVAKFVHRQQTHRSLSEVLPSHHLSRSC
jgi:hypothetical protein